jgi:uncharacterized protein (TIGR02145 family)
VPTDEEWTLTEDFLGGSSVAAKPLKSTSELWQFSNAAGNNLSGFSGLPGNYRGYQGGFNPANGEFGIWWNASETNLELARSRYLYWFRSNTEQSSDDKHHGFSVRCLKD